jgi:hypothetical protein
MRTQTKLLLLTTILAGGCTAAPDQTITGRVSPTGFPAPITGVQVVQHGKVVAEASLDTEGRFTVSFGAGRQYKMFLVSSDTARAQMIFPRKLDGSIDRTFDVHAAVRAVDVGTISYLGNPTGVSFAFDCVNGTSPSGGVCVDDEADAANNQDGIDEADGDNNQCGVNEPDGDNNQGGASEADGDNVTDLDADTAIGDNNVPEDVGCNSDNGPGTDDGPGTDEPGPDDPGTPPPGEGSGGPIL